MQGYYGILGFLWVCSMMIFHDVSFERGIMFERKVNRLKEMQKCRICISYFSIFFNKTTDSAFAESVQVDASGLEIGDHATFCEDPDGTFGALRPGPAAGPQVQLGDQLGQDSSTFIEKEIKKSSSQHEILEEISQRDF